MVSIAGICHVITLPTTRIEIRLGDRLPRPLFQARTGRISLGKDGYRLRFLNRTRQFAIPIDWHPHDLETGTRLWKLNLHYMEYLEEVDDTTFEVLVMDWIRGNRPYRKGYWLDSWNSFALSIRCVVWMQQYGERRDQLSSDFSRQMADSIREQLEFLLRNLETDIRGNHLIKNVKALLCGARYFGGGFSEILARTGEHMLVQEFKEQILPDGFHFELSPSYHCQVFADLLECFVLLPSGHVRAGLIDVLQRMAQALADMTHPDGWVSLLGDGGLQMAYRPTELLNMYQQCTGHVVTPSRDIAYPFAGYFGHRTEKELILCDLGNVGPDYLPAHAHGDIFSFEFSVGTQRVIVDTGVFEYDDGDKRAYSRSTRAHNTVTLDDLDQCEFWSSFRVGRRAHVERFKPRYDKGSVTLEGWHDGYKYLKGEPIHRRRFTVAKGGFSISDVIEGGSGQQARARLLLHPSVRIIDLTDSTARFEVGDVEGHISVEGHLSLATTNWWPDFGDARTTRQLVIDYGSAPCRGGFALEMRE